MANNVCGRFYSKINGLLCTYFCQVLSRFTLARSPKGLKGRKPILDPD